MENISLPWVLKLLEELRLQSKVGLDITENLSSPAAVLSFEMPPQIWISENNGDDSTIFSFVTDNNPFTFQCHLKKYPQLRELLARHCPTTDYQITDPWEKDRQREEKIAKLKARRTILARKHDEIATEHDRLVDEILALGESL